MTFRILRIPLLFILIVIGGKDSNVLRIVRE